MWRDLFESADLLQRGLNAAWVRDGVIRNNIANVETPGFKASEVVFESLMAGALQDTGFVGRKTRARHVDIGSATDIRTVSPRIHEIENTNMRMDENNVDIEVDINVLFWHNAFNSDYEL